MTYNFIRGDTKHFKFKIKQGDAYITAEGIDDIEFQINKSYTDHVIKKTLSAEQITFNTSTNTFDVYLSQSDTFKCDVGGNRVQVRVISGGEVKATLISTILVGESLSEGVLSTPNITHPVKIETKPIDIPDIKVEEIDNG